MIRFWWIAMRPTSIVKVTLPILVGLSIGFAHTQEIRPVYIAFALVFGWLDQLLIIFMNDYADAEADIYHTKNYPRLIDSRAVPNGWLEKREILIAGMVCATFMIAHAAILAIYFERAWAPALAATAIAFLWAYSFPPLKLNYRGFGELLESIGVGGVLPLAGFYFYTGELGLPLTDIVPVFILALASSLSSGVKHMPADRETGKRTVSVLFGPKTAVLISTISLAASILYCVMGVILRWYPVTSLLLTVVIPIFFWRIVAAQYATADHSNLISLKKFKGALHKAIYATNLGIALGFVFK